MSLYRVATANMFDRTVQNITQRQSELMRSQEQLSSGKRLLRASDDAVAATLAERAQNRLARVESDLVALDGARTALTLAETAAGEATELLHRARELVVQAGNPALTPSIREDMARQLEGLREQMLAVSNRQDTGGLALFSGLGGSEKPFVDLYGPNAGVSFQGQIGQYSATEKSLPKTIDGSAVWMRVPEGNGVITVGLPLPNRGTAAGAVVVNSPGDVPNPAPTYRVDFIQDPTDPQLVSVSVVNVTDGTVEVANTPYVDPLVVSFGAGAGDFEVTLTGVPLAGDALIIQPDTGLPPTYTAEPQIGNGGLVRSDIGTIVDATALTGDTYSVEFYDGTDGIEFRVLNLTTGAQAFPVPPAVAPFERGTSIEFDGIQLSFQGEPFAGDRIQVAPSVTTDLFKTLQDAIDALRFGGANQSAHLTQEMARVLNQMDAGMDRILQARGRLGDWLNRADSMESLFKDKALFHEKEKSDQEDLDMVKGISEFEQRQVALQAALQTYASVQKLSLFQYIA